jgi:hypothetical protein
MQFTSKNNDSILLNKFLDSAPPSKTLFKSIKYVRDTSRGSYRNIKRFGTIFCCSITITVILTILMVIPLAMIALGSVYIRKCTIQKMIPVWLIVFGSLSIIKNLSTLFQRIKSYIKYLLYFLFISLIIFILPIG